MRERLRNILERVPGAHRAHPRRDGLIALSVTALLLFAGYTRSVPFWPEDEPMVVRAEFDAANQVDSRTPVRVRGITVGRVASVKLSDSGRSASVTMHLTEPDVVVKRDARAAVRWRTLLGGSMFVDLDPGSPSAPADDGVIPRERTSTQVEFDDLNQPLDGGTAQANRDIIRGFSRGLDGRAAGRTISTLSPAFSEIRRGIRPLLGQRHDDLRRMVASTGRTLRGLGRNRRRLAGLVESAAQTLEVSATRRSEVGELLETSPPTMDATISTLTRLNGTLEKLDPLVIDLRPGVRELAPTLREVRPTLARANSLLRASEPLLTELPPTLERLDLLSREGPALFDALDPTLTRLDRELLPFLAERDPDTEMRNYTAIGATFAAISSGASEFDGQGYWLHFPTAADERTLGDSICQPFLTDPTSAEKLRCRQLGEVLAEVLGGGGNP